MRKIGVIGPEAAVRRIMQVAKTMNLESSFLPFAYIDAVETIRIIQENTQKVNGWLFSGAYPYLLAVESFGNAETFAYCAFDGAGFYRALLQASHQKQSVIERISIDIREGEIIEQVVEELGIPFRGIYIHKYTGKPDIIAIARFHKELWEAKETDAAITGLSRVYAALKEEGNIEVFWNNATFASIRDAIQLIIEKTEVFIVRNMQFGVCVIEAEDYDSITVRNSSSYSTKLTELKISKELIELSEKTDGCLVELGRGRYEILSSRGALLREVLLIKETARMISAEINLPIAIGIGFGENFSSTEINALRALSHSKNRRLEKIVIVEKDGVIVENPGSNQDLAYNCYADDRKLMDKLQGINVGVRSFKRIEAIVRKKGWPKFTSAQIAEELAVTERNIRRIFVELNRAGLIECIGEESMSFRGRPSKLYRLTEWQ